MIDHQKTEYNLGRMVQHCLIEWHRDTAQNAMDEITDLRMLHGNQRSTIQELQQQHDALGREFAYMSQSEAAARNEVTILGSLLDTAIHDSEAAIAERDEAIAERDEARGQLVQEQAVMGLRRKKSAVHSGWRGNDKLHGTILTVTDTVARDALKAATAMLERVTKERDAAENNLAAAKIDNDNMYESLTRARKKSAAHYDRWQTASANLTDVIRAKDAALDTLDAVRGYAEETLNRYPQDRYPQEEDNDCDCEPDWFE